MNRKVIFLPAIISFIASIIGVICYYSDIYQVTIICGIISLINSFLHVIFGNQNSLATEIVTIIIAAIIAIIFEFPFFSFVSLFICIADILFQLIGLIFMLKNINSENNLLEAKDEIDSFIESQEKIFNQGEDELYDIDEDELYDINEDDIYNY